MTRQIMGEVKRRRDALGLRAQDLSDRAEHFGVYLPRGVIAKLESGERKQITVPEVLALAAALDVAPLLLIAPLDHPQVISVLPGKAVPVEQAYAWLAEGVGDVGASVDYTATATPWADQRVRTMRSISTVQEHARLLGEIGTLRARVTATRMLRRNAVSEGKIEMADELGGNIAAYSRDLDEHWAGLLEIRSEMREQGYAVPALPSDLEQRGAQDVPQPWGADA